MWFGDYKEGTDLGSASTWLKEIGISPERKQKYVYFIP